MNSKLLNHYFISLIVLIFLFPTVYGQNVEVRFPKESLKSRVQKIVKKSGKNIIYDGELLDKIEVTSLTVPNGDMNEALRKSLVTTGFIMKTMADGSIAIRKGETLKEEKTNEKGRLSGRVTDDKGEPIAGANVMIAGTTEATFTDADGRYALTAETGSITLEVSFLAYQKKTITGLQVQPGKTRPLNIVLQEAAGQQLSEVVVTAKVNNASAQGLLLRQRSSISMIDGISAEQIKHTSDNNVAQVLKRVAGVTINEDKFVTVRGMSERYNNVQLNGSSLPSTEPNRRNFSFDIIPSTLIDNVTVNKTFTPDLPGEFTGGLVQVKTLSVPDAKFLSISMGTGGNTESTGKEFQTNKRYAADYLLGEIDKRTWYAGSGITLPEMM